MARRISQAPFSRREIRIQRLALARALERSHGIRVADSWTPLGYMLNRASLLEVKEALQRTQGNSDPIAGALEILAETVDA